MMRNCLFAAAIAILAATPAFAQIKDGNSIARAFADALPCPAEPAR